MVIHTIIVKRYLSYLDNNFKDNDEFVTNGFMMKELLRHSVCVGLGLNSACTNERLLVESVKCAKELFDGFDITDWSIQFKQSILEACVHCIELTIRKARK